MSFRKIQLIGNVGRAPEVVTFPNGSKVANFSVAVSEKRKNRATGEVTDHTSWFRVAAWQTGETGIVDGVIGPFVKRGQAVFIDGIPEIRTYEKDGVTMYAFQVRLGLPGTTIQLLGKRGDSAAAQNGADDGGFPANEPVDSPAAGGQDAGIDPPF